MQFSTKMRYGTRALVELARAYPEDNLSVREIAERQDISAKYLEHIMAQLKTAGIVRSVRGIHGGYCLAQTPGDCHLSEVFEAVEGSAAPVECVDEPEVCPLKEKCTTRKTWAEVKEAIMEVLERTTLQDLLERDEEYHESDMQSYQI
ncbi:MAG: RrF2 family transcriptional regulator [Candidatus Brocadiia bacterium]